MNEFEIVATFSLPSELPVALSVLESEGITCMTKDELTVQSHNFLSNAVGGIKLLVHQSDAERARKILDEGGFIKNKPIRTSKFERFLNDPDNYKKLKSWIIFCFSLLTFILLSIIIYGILE